MVIYLSNLFPTDVAADTSTEPRSAVQNDETENPSMKLAAKRKSAALITNVNNPSVTMVIGKVKINSTGRTKKLRTPRIIAAMIAI